MNVQRKLTTRLGWLQSLGILGLATATALAGGMVVGVNSAAAGTTTTVTSESEGFSLNGRAGGRVTDSSASAGSALLVWSNATATGSVTFTGPASGLTVRARGEQCQGAPVVDVNVDGVALGGMTVSSTSWRSYSLAGTWNAGTHSVSLGYGNDFLAAGCDRNVYLDKVSFTVAAVPQVIPRYFGMSESDGAHRGLNGAVATAAALGQRVDEFNFYMAWEYQEPFPTADVEAVVAAGAIPSVTWEPWQPGAGTNQSKYSLEKIISGNFDVYIDTWARNAAAFGKPMKLRFAHEMNGNWYPWSPSVNGNTSSEYIAAFRHVHDRFVAAGATNVNWVWSMNVVEGMPTAINQVYPGNAYVDSIGIDGYNGGTDSPGMGGWKTPTQLFGPTLAQIGQIAPGKPVYVAETGCAVGGGDKAGWIGALFTYLRTTTVAGVDWFEFGGYPDWRLISSTGATNAARAALANW